MGMLSKNFRCFEIQTSMQFLDRLEVSTPDGILRGRRALEWNLEHYESVESVVGGRHYKDWTDRSRSEHVQPHVHYYVKLKDSRKLSTILGKINGRTVSDANYIAPDLNNENSLCIGGPQIENIQSSFSKCYDYLLHQDEKSMADIRKEQYTEEEVEIYMYGTTTEEVKNDTEYVGKKGGRGYNNSVEDFMSLYGTRIENGEITRSRYMKDPSIVPGDDFVKYNVYFERLFKRQEALQLAKINEGGDSMEIIYCYGDAGTGKTTFAKEYCKAHGYDFFVSGSSNDAFDGYLGEEAIILDDLRGSCFAFADLLKILDPNTRSKVQSRYYNKVVTCKVIIITSIMSIDKLYTMFDRDTYKEPLEQLKRRCRTCMRFSERDVEVYLWNKAKRQYDFVSKTPNTYINMYDAMEMTEEQKLAYVADLLNKTADSMKQAANYVKNNQDNIIQNQVDIMELAKKDAEQLTFAEDPNGYMIVPDGYKTPFDD